MDKEFNLDKEFEIKGYWWIPGNENKKIFGILNYSVIKGIYLTLYEYLQKESKINYKIDLIYGETLDNKDNKKISIHNCILIGIYENTIKVIIKGLELFIGDLHVPNNFYANKIEVNYTLLDSWLGRENPYNIQTTLKKDKKELIKFKLEYQPPKDIFYKFNFDNLKLNLGFIFSFTTNQKIYGSFASKEKSLAVFSTEQNVDYKNYFLKYINIFQSFLTFAIDNLVIPTKIHIFLPNNSELEYYRIFVKEIPSDEYKLQETMLLPYKNIKNKFVDIFEKWFEIYNILELGFLNSLYYSSLNPIYIFITIIPKLEIFFINYYPDESLIIEKNNFKELKGNIIKLIEKFYLDKNLNFKNDKNLWSNKIDLLNNISLRRILKKIITENENILYTLKIFNSRDEIDNFINDVCNSRNYYIHLLKDYKDKAKKGGELYDLTLKLHLTLIILILKSLRFNQDEIVIYVKRILYRFNSSL